MDQYARLIQQSVAQNNAWSAQQAANQMDFQERMSNTAHQREIADLKAAGLNPVLSARLGGASTPTGAMGSTDTGMTSALVDLLQMSMDTAQSAAGAAYNASTQEGVFGLPLIKNPRQPWQIAYNWLVSDDKVKSFGDGAAKNAVSALKSWLDNTSAKALSDSMAPAYGLSGRHTKGGAKNEGVFNWLKRLF